MMSRVAPSVPCRHVEIFQIKLDMKNTCILKIDKGQTCNKHMCHHNQEVIAQGCTQFPCCGQGQSPGSGCSHTGKIFLSLHGILRNYVYKADKVKLAVKQHARVKCS